VVSFTQCIHRCGEGTEAGLPLELTIVDKRSPWHRFRGDFLDYHLLYFAGLHLRGFIEKEDRDRKSSKVKGQFQWDLWVTRVKRLKF
jgi:hypothetical protein